MIEITAGYLASQGLSENFPQRFWGKVNKTDTCWLWSGARQSPGYGKITRGAKGAGQIFAHRASWILNCGPIPDGLLVMHRCDNPPCVNDAHLFLGTDLDNMRDMWGKGRARPGFPIFGEDHGMSKLTRADVTIIRSLYDGKTWTQYSLAARFKVARATIRNVLKFKTWKD